MSTLFHQPMAGIASNLELRAVNQELRLES